MYSKLNLRSSAKTRENIIFLICMVCVFLFLYTAYSKIIDHQRFFNGLDHVDALKPFAETLSWAIPVAEILTGILLINTYTYKTGLVVFLILMVIFTGYIVSMLLWAKTLPCHCGGVIEKLSWGQHVWFNLGFIVLATFALRLSKPNTTF